MHRNKFTEKLIRIMKAVEAGELPTTVTELYAFGSYARGAIEPGDLDLVVIHKPDRKAYIERKSAYFQSQGYSKYQAVLKAATTFEVEIRAALRKPGERIQILLQERLDWVVGKDSRIKASDLVLLWSIDEPEWKSKLAGIKADENAGRASRNHLVELKRLDCSVGAMEAVVEMVESSQLTLARVPIESINLKLNAVHRHWLAHWTRCKVMGKESMKTLPYAMWWLEQQRQRCEVPDRTEIWNKRRTYRLEVGKPSFRWMVHRFETMPKLVKQCLIPHFKAKGPNELLVFERGANWKKLEDSDPLHKKLFDW
jgi:predicted nucleotidyltransferase